MAHAVAEGDKGFIQESSGVMLLPFIYMGAKHMMTGYDHLLFLFGVIFFLYRLKDVGLYVTLFAVGHSVTLLLGVLTEWTAPCTIDISSLCFEHRRKSMSTQRFTPEFKAEAVRQVIERGYSVADIAERLGVSTHSLYKWVKAVTPDKTEKQASELLEAKSEILRLRAQMRRLEEERDILKKAARYFAREPE